MWAWKPFETALVLYLILAPVYWLPGISIELMSLLKLGLFAAVAGLAVMRLPGLWGANRFFVVVTPWLGLLVATAIPGVLQTENEYLPSFAFDFAMISLAMFVGFVLVASRGPLRKYLAAYVCGLAIISAVSIFVTAPTMTRDGDEVLIAAGGFAPGRTGWSNGIAFAGVIALLLCASARGSLGKALFALAFAGVASSQIYFGGRSGFIAPILAFGAAVFVLGVTGGKSRIMWGVMFGLVATLAWGLYSQEIESAFRLDRQVTTVYSSQWDAILSGRLSNWQLALQLIGQRPLFGYGFNDWSESGNWGNYFVHNEWLKFTYQGGIFYALMWAVFVASLLKTAREADRVAIHSGSVPVFTAVILTALVITFSEPNTLIGVFQKSAPLWVVIGGAIAQRAQVRSFRGFRNRAIPA